MIREIHREYVSTIEEMQHFDSEKKYLDKELFDTFTKNGGNTDEIFEKYIIPFLRVQLHMETIKVIDELSKCL